MQFGEGLESGAFQKAVHKSLSTWSELSSSDEELLGFLLLVRKRRSLHDDSNSPLELRRATNEVLLDAIEKLAQEEELEAKILRYRFMEGWIMRRVANMVHAGIDQVNRWQRSAITNLSQILMSQEKALREQRRLSFESSLPAPPYSRLFGFQDLRNHISNLLIREDDTWIVTIVGIGGIGKTSLADAVVRETIDSLAFDKIFWSRISIHRLSGGSLDPQESYERFLHDIAQQLWPGNPLASTIEIRQRLRLLLKSQPHLIVIDNLESEEVTEYLLSQVRELTNPSKFLITSRSRPSDAAGAYVISVEELSLADAEKLLRFQAKAIGLTELTLEENGVFQSIFQLSGGNPLALKLVVSLASVLPLSKVLSDLAENKPGPIENLYRYIYWESWRTLSQDAQALLQAMPLVADPGALPEQMITISGLDELAFWPAVTELVTRSLLEVRGTVHERRYGIHRLTDSFLRTDIIHWVDE